MNVFARLPRLAYALVIIAAVALTGCSKDAKPLEAKEGGRIYLDGLFYQVQLSRSLTLRDVEDSYYLVGQPAPKAGESYFGVFMRVDNEDSKFRQMPVAIKHMKVVNAAGDEFEPIPVQAKGWGYEPAPLGKGAHLPIPDSPADIGPIRGGLILFRIPEASLDARPLELEIEATGHERGQIILDV